LEQYLRCTLNHQQDNWVSLLPLAEFAFKNARHSSTQVSPFFANFGYHPRFDATVAPPSKNTAAENRVAVMLQTQQLLVSELRKAQARHKSAADQLRKEGPAFKPGDKVWLLSRNIKSTRPNAKFDFRRLGPFSISRQVNPVTFKLDLPAAMRIHDVFHVSLLEPFVPNTIPGRVAAPPPVVEVDGKDEYEVEEILDSCRRRGKLFLPCFLERL